MPRIYNTESLSFDFCQSCFPSEAAAEEDYGIGPDGPDGRGNCYGYEESHPPYDDTDYKCEECGCELTDDDD